MSYGCPKCDWDWGNEGFYYVDGEDAIDCTKYVKDKLIAKPPKGKKAYPIYSNYQHNMAAAINFGGNPHDWEELHCCPSCNEEFEVTNSNY